MRPTPLDLRREDYPDLNGPRLDKLLRSLNTSVGSIVQILAGQSLFRDNLRAVTREITFTTQDEWSTLTLANSWATYSGLTPRYRWRSGKIELRGAIQPGTTGTSVQVATAPTGGAPSAVRYFPVLTVNAGGNSVLARISAATTGAVTLEFATFPLSYVALDGIGWEPSSPTAHPNGVFPISVKNDLGAAPAGAWVWSASDITSLSASPVALGPVAWSVSKDQVVISDIGNVLPGRKYRVRLVLVAG